MQLIPVLDILGGEVVRAVRGDRDTYRPVESRLCETSDPLRVARILLEHCASDKLYVADLDALLGRAPQTAVLQLLLEGLEDAEIWLDGGFATLEAATERRAVLGSHAHRVTPVFGSESLGSHQDVERCLADRDHVILSLDLRQGRRLDPAACWTDASVWPARIIVMTLDRVGAFAGPDLKTFADVRRRARDAAIIGAGGIRDPQDLASAANAGAHAWLVASALHDLRIPRAVKDEQDVTLSKPAGHGAIPARTKETP